MRYIPAPLRSRAILIVIGLAALILAVVGQLSRSPHAKYPDDHPLKIALAASHLAVHSEGSDCVSGQRVKGVNIPSLCIRVFALQPATEQSTAALAGMVSDARDAHGWRKICSGPLSGEAEWQSADGKADVLVGYDYAHPDVGIALSTGWGTGSCRGRGLGVAPYAG